jgi:NAD+ kinase
VKKPGHAGASAKLGEIADWLEKRGVETFVERAVHETEFRSLSPYVPSVTRVDFAITLGGDGTVLHLASLFDEEPLPPVAAFAMGTLGFLTPFDPAAHDETLSRILNASSSGSGNGGGSNGAGGYGSGGNGGAAAAAPAPLYCSLRTRKACEVYDAAGARVARHHVLNDAVIDRCVCVGGGYIRVWL